MVNCTVDRRSCCSHFTSHVSDSQIFIENRHFWLPHVHSTSPLSGSPSEYCHGVWYAKSGMVGEKCWRYHMFICFDRVHERDGQTDRHIPMAWPRLCIASRVKMEVFNGCLHPRTWWVLVHSWWYFMWFRATREWVIVFSCNCSVVKSSGRYAQRNAISV